MHHSSPTTPNGATTSPGRSVWAEGPASLPMYVAGWIVAVCGLYAVNAALEEPGFINLSFVLTTIGFVVSYVGRRHQVAAGSLQVLAGIAAAAVLLIAIIGGPPLSLLLPISAAGDQQKSMAVFLTWAGIVMSFTLNGDAWLLLLCVLTLARIGLVSTMAVDAPITTDFIVFLLATAFMMVHENALRTPAGREGGQQPGRGRSVLASQVVLASICIAGAAVGATFLSGPLHAIGSAVSLTAGIVPVSRQSRLHTLSSTPRFSESPEKQVGQGPVTESDQIVLKVRTDFPTYLRGATYNYYTGRSWRSTFGPGPDLRPSDSIGGGDPGYVFYRGFSGESHTFKLRPNPLTETGTASRTVRQEFRVQGGVFNDVYAAAELRELRLFHYRLQTDEAGGVHPVGPIQTTYTAVSQVPDASAEVLRAAGSAYPAVVTGHYLKMGDDPGAAQRLAGRARSITAGKSTPYDKVAALREWVSQHCTYNLNAAAVPAGQDVASYFLFQSKEGYCDAFATALTLLCRGVRIPARIATGFLPGELDPYSGNYLVRERDLHMWTEVFFPKVGWVPFDATEGSQDVTPRGGAAVQRNVGFRSFLFGRGALPPLALMALLAMVAYVLKVEVLDRRRRRARAAGASLYALPMPNAAVVDAYAFGCHLLGRRGIPRRAADTPFEYLHAMEARLAAHPAAVGALTRLTRMCVRARYSGETVPQADVEEAKAALGELRQALRGVRKRDLVRPVGAPQGA